MVELRSRIRIPPYPPPQRIGHHIAHRTPYDILFIVFLRPLVHSYILMYSELFDTMLNLDKGRQC